MGILLLASWSDYFCDMCKTGNLSETAYPLHCFDVVTVASVRLGSLTGSVHNVVFHSILHYKRQGGLPFVDTSLLKIASISDFFNRACFIRHLPEKVTSVSQASFALSLGQAI